MLGHEMKEKVFQSEARPNRWPVVNIRPPPVRKLKPDSREVTIQAKMSQ